MTSPIILSRTPFRLPLGGGSTDLPSYYEKYGGFIFAVAINIYMDIFVKEPIVDDYIHMHYMKYEFKPFVDKIKHTIGREALKMTEIDRKVLVSFTADTPAGTGLGSSGACSVGLLKGLALYQGKELNNQDVAERAFQLTQRLGLPDGKQDPYVCALGGFVVLEIDKDGSVNWFHPNISSETTSKFFKQTLFYYTGIKRYSKPLLDAQNKKEVMNLKHGTKKIGREIYQCFLKGNLDGFGELMHEHWEVKKKMAKGMSSSWLNDVYNSAKKAGALGGKILGAGGGGYFMFYCPSEKAAKDVQLAIKSFGLRKMVFGLDTLGARVKRSEL